MASGILRNFFKTVFPEAASHLSTTEPRRTRYSAHPPLAECELPSTVASNQLVVGFNSKLRRAVYAWYALFLGQAELQVPPA